uniref:BTB domain-containing protein n=1 Tax=Panagrellus redivivus TaxID=6233 RepID=A0A7E4V3A7_PANRE
MALQLPPTNGNNGLNPMCFTNEIAYGIFEQLRLQRVEGKYCDVVIVVKERQFAAHRNVLSACSPFFESILHTDKIFKEKISVRVEDVETFELFLNFLYGATITVDRRTVGELLVMASNFLVARLRAYCIEYLQNVIDNTNCIDISRLAERCNLPGLYKHATDYMDNNIDNVLIESEDLLEESSQSLRMFIEDLRCRLNVSPECHFRCLLRWVGHNLIEREHEFYEILKTCMLHEIQDDRLHSILDNAVLFKQSRKCFLDVLHFMYEEGVLLGKFEPDYAMLLQACQRGELFYCDNKQQVDPQYLYENTNDDDALGNLDGNDEASDVDDMMSELLEEPMERPKLKLKINLGAGSPKKAPAARDPNIPRKRGRPPKPRPPPQEIDYENLNEEPSEVFYEFDESAIPTFDEPDDFNPDQVASNSTDDIGAVVCGVETQDPDNEFHCEYCNFKTYNATNLKRHTAAAHLRNVVHCCNRCSFETKWNRAFYDHARTHIPGPPFRCDSCEYTVDRIHVLLTHRLTHPGDPPFKCSECDFRGLFKSHLINHHRIHTGEKPYLCPDCNKGFAMKFSLQKHMSVHSTDRPFSCRECDFTAKYQSELIAHRRNHSGDLFFCQQAGCTYSSPKKSQLAAHLRTHLAVRSHQCQICKRSFIEKSHLVRHERIHLIEKPFKCENCEYASSRRDKLKEHILKHHNAQQSPKTHRRRFRRAKQVAQLAAQAIDPTRMQPVALDEETFFQPIEEPSTSSQQQPHQQMVHTVQYDPALHNDGAYMQNPPQETSFLTSEGYVVPMDPVTMMAVDQPSSSQYINHDEPMRMLHDEQQMHMSHEEPMQQMGGEWPMMAPMRPASESLPHQHPMNTISPSPSLKYYPHNVQQQHVDNRQDVFFTQQQQQHNQQHKDDLGLAGVDISQGHLDMQRPLSLPSYGGTQFFISTDNNINNQHQQFMHPQPHVTMERYLQNQAQQQTGPSISDQQQHQVQDHSPIQVQQQQQQQQQPDQWWP